MEAHAEAGAGAMLVACRLAGLSALEAQYAGVGALTQCECVRLHVGVEVRRRPRPSEVALSRCHAKSASGLGLTDFQAAATASRHAVIAAARSTR